MIVNILLCILSSYLITYFFIPIFKKKSWVSSPNQRTSHSGIIPLALALEHCGYQKFSGNLLNEKEKEKVNNRGNYIILSGDPSLSPNK